MGVSYVVENESIGGGIGGGIGMGGGSSIWFLVIFFIILFALFEMFRSKGEGHQMYANANRGPSPYEIDKDITNGNCAVISDNHAIYEKQQDEKLSDSKMETYFLKGQLADNAKLAPILAELASIKCGMPKMRPEYVNSQLASVENCRKSNDYYCE